MRVLGFLTLLTVLSLTAEQAHAQISDGIIKIGVLNDESGPYAALAGPGSRVAALMAVEDFGAAAKGMKVEIVFADHQNKPDVGAKIAREWYDTEKVDVIVDVPTSSVTLAVLPPDRGARRRDRRDDRPGAASRSDPHGRPAPEDLRHRRHPQAPGGASHC